mgnify:CR=1 FL=1
MNLYRLTAGDNYKTFHGVNPPHSIERVGMFPFAQLPDCSAFLILSKKDWDDDLGLELLDSIPSGAWVFTYCQEWGLDVNQTVLDRVIADIG